MKKLKPLIMCLLVGIALNSCSIGPRIAYPVPAPMQRPPITFKSFSDLPDTICLSTQDMKTLFRYVIDLEAEFNKARKEIEEINNGR